MELVLVWICRSLISWNFNIIILIPTVDRSYSELDRLLLVIWIDVLSVDNGLNVISVTSLWSEGYSCRERA